MPLALRVYCVIFAILLRLCLKVDGTEKELSDLSRAPIRSRGEVKKSNYLKQRARGFFLKKKKKISIEKN